MNSIYIFVMVMMSTAHGQIITSGQCNESSAIIEDFDMQRYLGTWYQIFHIKEINNTDSKCLTTNYFVNGSTVILDTRGVLNGQVVRQRQSGKIMIKNHFLLDIPESSSGEYYRIVSTNYTSYSVVYTCRSHPNNTKTMTITIFSRMPYLKPEDAHMKLEFIKHLPGMKWPIPFHSINQWEKPCTVNSSSMIKVLAFLLILPVLPVKLLSRN